MKIGFVGMSHLGLVSSIGSAEMGAQVVAFDHNESLVSNLNSGQFTIIEPSIEFFLSRNNNRIKFTSKLQDLSDCDLVFISLDVHTNEQNESDLVEISDLIIKVDKVLSRNSCLIILSQIPPGFCRNIQSSIQSLLVYQVETLVFGDAFSRFISPERIIIGLPSSTMPLNPIHHQFLLNFDCPILVMSYESAEVTKISINTFLAASITATNSMSEISENVGANWIDVKKALVLDRRIGHYAYLTPGLGISGGNIERDLSTAKSLALKYGSNSDLFDAVVSNSSFRKLWPARIVLSKINKDSNKIPLAIWGLTYKANTHSLKNSPAIENMRLLSKYFTFNVFEPNISNLSFLEFPALLFSTMADSLNNVAALLILNDSSEFNKVSPEELSRRMSRKLVIDPLGVLSLPQNLGFEYFTLGASMTKASHE